MVVDDSIIIREYLKRALSRIRGCNLVGTASDGEEGLIMIRMLHPKVVLLDVSMPVKNGPEMLRELRKENSDVIVIMFTADSTPGLKEKCLQYGANHFVNKDDFKQLVEIFSDLLRKQG